MRELLSKFKFSLVKRAVLADEIANEIESHVMLRADENVESGMTPAAAIAEARRHFGNAALTGERAREAWQFPGIESFVQDLRYGLRGIRRSPGFSIAVILTLALGIGANTAIFSVVYNVLLRPLPYPSGERLVMLGESAGKASGISVTWINYQHWRAENHAFEGIAAMTSADLTMTGRGEAKLTHSSFVTASFFGLTGATAQVGRVFSEAEDRVGAPAVAVLSWEFWNKEFGGNPAALGATLTLNGKPYQVIGVLRPGLRLITARSEYYLPLGPSAGKTTNRAAHGNIRALGLLRPGVTLAAARANLDEILKRLALSDPGPESAHRGYAEYLTETVTGGIRSTLLILMGAVGLLLFIACANVASLLLVRGATRTREIAIRTAIGAGRARVARQLLTENVAISAIGGALGIVVALVSLRVLLELAPATVPRLAEISLNLPVLAFAAAVTVFTGFLAGLAPVFSSGKVNVAVALKDGAAGGGSLLRGHRIRGALIVAEVAITVVLTFGSALLIRSLMAAQNTNPGFDYHNLLALELQLPSSGYKTDAQARQFYTTLMEALRHEPGVTEVGAVTCSPGEGDCGDWWYSPLDRPAPARADVPLTLFETADPAYFRTMRIKLLAGRSFLDSDRDTSLPVAIVNEQIARKWWRRPQDAVGRQIKFGGPYAEGSVVDVVGVASDVSQMGLDGESVPLMYFPLAQQGSRALEVMLRTAGSPAALIPAVRRRVAALDRNLPIQSLIPYEEKLGASLARRRFSTLLLSVFAGLAMFVAAIGIYGVLNYWVGIRNREIAVRLALGAPRSRILRWVGSHAMRLTLAGVAIGVAGCWSASRLLSSMVYGVSIHSPMTMLMAGIVVVATALAASGLPVWRASRVDVGRSLRDA